MGQLVTEMEHNPVGSSSADPFGSNGSNSSSDESRSASAINTPVQNGTCNCKHANQAALSNGSNTSPPAPFTLWGKEESQCSKLRASGTIFSHEQRLVHHLCDMCSSVYYGRPDSSTSPEGSQNSNGFKPFRNKFGEDEEGYAERGNWWLGGLYY